MVTVQLPLYNEPRVAERLLLAVGDLDYPLDRLEIQVLDDSTDDTGDRIAAAASLLRQRGLVVEHLRRADRVGFKAGALAAGLRRACGELLCIFDADFVPPADFLRRTVPHFADTGVGLVQARWGHLNRQVSLLTRVQALLLDAHFAVEQAGRFGTGRLFNFNGTAGVWRRAAIDAAGGWEQDTLTEDLDLSYRAQLAGWRFLYVDAPEAPAELPLSVAALKGQQHRWTKGAVQTARKLLLRLWRSRLSLGQKIEATFHLTANFAYPAIACISVLAVPTMMLRHQDDYALATAVDVGVLLLATGSVAVFFAAGQLATGRSALAAVLRLPALMALGIGMSVNNTRAALEGLAGGRGEFVRTPKTASTGQCSEAPVAARRPASWQVAVELALAAYFAGALVVVWKLGLWTFLPFVLLFLVGYAWVGIGSLVGSRREPSAEVSPARVPA